jgi:hypothetical protein
LGDQLHFAQLWLHQHGALEQQIQREITDGIVETEQWLVAHKTDMKQVGQDAFYFATHLKPLGQGLRTAADGTLVLEKVLAPFMKLANAGTLPGAAAGAAVGGALAGPAGATVFGAGGALVGTAAARSAPSRGTLRRTLSAGRTSRKRTRSRSSSVRAMARPYGSRSRRRSRVARSLGR